MNVSKMGLMAALVASIVAQPVSAATKFDDETPSPSVQSGQAPSPSVQSGQAVGAIVAEYEKGRLVETGAPKKGVQVIKGFGKDVSVLLALKQITPPGWLAKKDGKVDVSKTVSWKGGRAWTEIMSDVALAGDINVLVKWDEKTLVISAPKAIVKMARVSEAQRKILPQRWALEPGRTLRENVEAWAAQTSNPRWHISWNGANYMIQFPATFTGKFDDEQSGPIASLVEAFRTHDVPLRAEFQDDNHVLRIENASFSQQRERINKLEEPWNGTNY